MCKSTSTALGIVRYSKTTETEERREGGREGKRKEGREGGREGGREEGRKKNHMPAPASLDGVAGRKDF